MDKYEVAVALTVTDFQEHPSKITEILGVQPSKSWLKGDLINERTTIRYKQNGWKITPPLLDNNSLSTNINTLFNVIEPFMGNFNKLPYCVVEISCCIYVYEYMPEIFVEPYLVKKISEINAGLDIDIIWLTYNS